MFHAKTLSLLIGFAATLATASAEKPCRSIEYARIENTRDLSRLADVCEITHSLAVFLDGEREITVPRLRRVGIVNIESRGLEAVAFPALEQVRDMYLTGTDLKVVELPRLRYVSSRLVIQEKNLQFLNLPELQQVGRFILNGCQQLEFVFADRLREVGSLRMDNNPALNPASAENLQKVTRVMTEEELAFIKNAQEEMRLFKRRLMDNALNQPPIRPTGHETHFDSFGLIKNYYDWYPYEYSRYWDVIGPWGYTFFYTSFPPFFYPY
ncbi:MAG: hypothetical protein ACKOA8_09830 [Deltaproteobacteria bacterium]